MRFEQLGQTLPRERERAYDRKKQEGASISVVIAREGGRSSTPRLLDRTRLSLEYWIARSSRAMTAEVTWQLN
jgi:hypothetical protein